MKIAVFYLGMAVVGYLAATPLRKKKVNTDFIGKLFTIVVTSLIGLMGFRIGSNEETVANIGEIGLASLGMAVFSLIVCLALNHLLRKLLKFETDEKKPQDCSISDAAAGIAIEIDSRDFVNDNSNYKKKKTGIPKSTVRYIIAAIFGFLIGYFAVIRFMAVDYTIANNITGKLVGCLLYLLVFSVGMDFGAEGAIGDILKQINLTIVAIPVVTAFGTIISILAFSFLLPLNLKETICVACTFGWYSLGPNIMIDAGMITAAAYAFLTNFFRDMISLFTISIVAEKIGYMETICMPQAASMDLCIATIEAATDKKTTFMSFASGAIFTAAVPILLPIIAGM